MLTTLAFVNPHRQSAWTYRRVPATDPRRLPAAERGLDLAEFHEATATTAFQVLVDGVVVHSWYAEGLGPGDLFLGASATKSVLAHLVAPARLDLDAPVEAYVPELADSGYRGVPVRDVARMTSGVDWVEDHRDPRGPADASSRPSLPFLRPGRLPPPLSRHVGFGFHWWPLDHEGTRVAADGSRGQFVYVDRPRRTVVVKTSAWPDADPAHDARCRDLTYRTLPAIVTAATEGEVVQR